MASAGDIAELQEIVGDYQNTTTFFTKKNKVYCAPLREFAQAMCKHCEKNHYIDTLCSGGDAFKPTPANKRHSSCPSDMAKAMDDNTFKRLTFRFQGGKGGLPKATFGTEAVAAALTVTVALGTAKKQTQEAHKAKRQQKAKDNKAKQAEDDANAGGSEVDEAEETPDVPSIPEEDLPTATRTMTIHRPAGRSQIATREQRRGTTSVLTIMAKRQRRETSSGLCSTPTPSAPALTWRAMAMVATGMARMRARMRATLVGAMVRRATVDTALQLWNSLRLQHLEEIEDRDELKQQMSQWRARTARAMATIKVSATVTMAIVKLKSQYLERTPTKLPPFFLSLKSLYHPGMCLGTTRDHSRAPGAPDGHSKCTFFAFFGPGRAIIRSRAAKTLDSNSDTTTHRSRFVSSGHG